MSKTVIKVDNISKMYQLGQINTGTISDDLKRWWSIKRGKGDPFLALGEENDRTQAGKSNIVWSLKDVSFDVQQGDILGVIGRNGAGKSTLLKILSEITSPTTGSIKIKGKIASLLEVGTGFHPELSGRDNVFLNGAILGMRKAEIKKKFDEIVDFSGVERYIDTPVKRYSSGMYVRLAFAVAAHLESDILIVDEVLAVGDAEFQKKCMGKMGQLGKDGGRTVFFVSHGMGAIKSLCNRCLYLDKGKVVNIGDTQTVISQYLRSGITETELTGEIPKGLSLHGTGEARFTSCLAEDMHGKIKTEFFFGENITAHIRLHAKQNLNNVVLAVHVVSVYGERLAMATPDFNYKPISLEAGIHDIKVLFEDSFMPGDYSFALSLSFHNNGADIDFIESFFNFKILRDSIQKELDYPWGTVHGFLRPKTAWSIQKVNS